VAVVVGILILTIVWSGVTAYERFGQQQTAEQTAAQKRDAVKAANSAYAEVEKRNVKEAEARAREAIKLQPVFPPAWDALGRALAMQDRTDEAAEAFDRAMETAAVVVRSGAPPEQLAEAERVARGARDWKALALYNDGTRQLGRDVPLARRRFEETIRTAPGSTEADNAKEQLRRLPADTVVAPVVPGAAPDAGAVATPGVAPSATQPTDTGPPSQPADWDVSYKQQGRSPY
jgi:tetratricopeptide (TPR) repeat protein